VPGLSVSTPSAAPLAQAKRTNTGPAQHSPKKLKGSAQ
jgi:hypothetical protein